MSTRRQRRRRQIENFDGSVALQDKTKGSSCKQGENSPCGHIEGYSGPQLPEDIWCHIHSLTPMRDAARVACVSHYFVNSWRCHPNLTFDQDTLGLNENTCRSDDKMRHFTKKVDNILENHSGIGVKSFKLEVGTVYNRKDSCHLDHLDSWLQFAVKPGIEELKLSLSTMHANYNFPCSLLSGGTSDSLRCIFLVACNFRPSVGFDGLRSLTRLHLHAVYIRDDNLSCVFSNTCALEWLELWRCNSIICVKIPCLQKLSHLDVSFCTSLRLIESKAPNLSSFCFGGNRRVQLSLGDTLRIKKLNRSCINAALYARTELPSSMPYLEDLTLCSDCEMVNTPMEPSKFLHLKFLSITLSGRSYDFFSLVSFLYASPSLETFTISVFPVLAEQVSIFANPSDLRIFPEYRHDKLKHAKIINFFSAKGLVELTCHILESASSLERLTLDTTAGALRCFDSVNKSRKCLFLGKEELMEARRALMAIQVYIKPKAPPTVDLNVLEPCSRCHAVEL